MSEFELLTRRSARLIGKVIAGLTLGAVFGLAMSLSPETTGSPLLNTLGGAFAFGIIFLLYEGLWRLVGWPLHKLFASKGSEPAVPIGYGVVGYAPASDWPPQPRVKHAILLIAVYLGGVMLVWLFIGGIVGATTAGDPRSLEDRIIPLLPGGLLAGLFLGLICVWLAVQWLRNRRGIDVREVAAWARPTAGDVVPYLTAGLLLGLTYILLAVSLAPPDEGTSFGVVSTAAAESLAVRIAWATGGLAIAPVIEEFLFRGVLFGTVARSRGVGVALVVATVPFVLLHITETGSYWPALLGITSMAVTANIARLRTGKLASAMATHFGYNLMLVMVAMWVYA